MSGHKHGSWIGYDFDGTIALYDGWKGDDVLGAPIPSMIRRIKRDLEAGYEVRIFTARAGNGPTAIALIEAWCLEHVGVKLPVTDQKDFKMVRLYDDRAVAVEENTGRTFGPKPEAFV